MTGTEPTQPDEPPRTMLNSALARRLRLQRCLSERDVAKRLGVTSPVIASLERGRNHPELPTALVVRLAEILGVTPGELFTPEPDQTPSSGRRDDVAAVGALLVREQRMVAVPTLAEVLGWDLDRTREAIDGLAAALPTVGLRVHRLNGDVSVVADHAAATQGELTALSRRAFARRGMTLAQARMLHKVFTGDTDALDHANPGRVTLGELLNADLLRHDAGQARGGRPSLSPDVLDGLHHILPRRTPSAVTQRRAGRGG